MMSDSCWIIFRKLDKLWSYAYNGEPGAPVSKEVALSTLHKLRKEIAWHIKDECDQYIIWKFEV